MQFERLKKSHKKQIIIGALAICVIGGALTFSLTRAKYEIANDLELAKGTINYKVYDFKIMAMYKSDDKENYTEIEEMPSEGYTINESKSYCNMSNGSKDETAILKTIDGNHIISKLKKNDRCYLYFDKKITASETILANVTVNEDTPDFSQVATEDEGVYITDDPMYGTNAKTYYWRGAATTNYLKFANFCWRIIRINGDGSLRLIYDGSICHQNGESTTDSIAVQNVSYNASSSRSEYVGWTYVEGKQRPEEGDTVIDSNAKIKTEEWYNNNIGNNTNYDSKVAIGKFCNDRRVEPSKEWNSQASYDFNYIGWTRINLKSLSFDCLDLDIYNLKVGAITLDETNFAGGLSHKTNEKYYLVNGSTFWNMTPFYWYSREVNYGVGVAVVSSNGITSATYTNGTISIRPVINLKSDITLSGGDGTLNNPYFVS